MPQKRGIQKGLTNFRTLRRLRCTPSPPSDGGGPGREPSSRQGSRFEPLNPCREGTLLSPVARAMIKDKGDKSVPATGGSWTEPTPANGRDFSP